MLNYLRSGWSFFFRWPSCHPSEFKPGAILLAPLLQSLALAGGLFLGKILFRHPGLEVFFGLVMLAAWTGFFHEDGWADTADSLGVSKFDESSTTLDRITAAFRDPRLGTFGVSALSLLWVWRFAAAAHMGLDAHGALVVCFLSRGTALGLGAWAARQLPVARTARASHQLGLIPRRDLVLTLGVQGIVFLGVLLVVHFDPASGVIEIWNSRFLMLVANQLILIVTGFCFLSALSRRSHGLNGDILGATVCLLEIVAGFLWVRP